MKELDICDKVNLLSHYGFVRVTKSSSESVYVSNFLWQDDLELLEKLGFVITCKDCSCYVTLSYVHD